MNFKIPTVRLAPIISLYILISCLFLWSGVEAMSTCALSCGLRELKMLREPGAQAGWEAGSPQDSSAMVACNHSTPEWPHVCRFFFSTLGFWDQGAWEENRVFRSDSHSQTYSVFLHNLARIGSYRTETDLHLCIALFSCACELVNSISLLSRSPRPHTI